MDNPMVDKIIPFVSIGVLVVFALFVVVGLLFGLMRGAKRSVLRLVLLISLLVVAFFITPYIVDGALGLNVQIAGQTPRQFVDNASNRLIEYMQQQFGDYIVPFQDYIKEYALGIVMAGLNLAIFFALYFIVRIVSWMIYAIMARFVAPKRNREGERLPKHTGWGMLVGALQGVLLFVFFMFPFNGALGVVNQAVEYKAMQAESQTISTQTAMDSGHRGDRNYIENLNEEQVQAFLDKMQGPLQVYNGFMKYTGLQFLSNKAFEYQLTIRFDETQDINLVHDLNSCVEMYLDAKDLLPVMEKFQNVYADGKIDLTALNHEDYEVLRSYINRVFDLEILHVADQLLADMDKIFNTPFNNSTEKLAGTEIYKNSLYGILIQQNTTERTFTYEPGEGNPTNYAQYAAGLQTVVRYVGDQKLNLVRDDLLNTLDLMEIFGKKVNYEGLAQPKAVSAILAQGNLGIKDYFDLATAKLVNKQGQTTKTYLIDVLGEQLKDFSAVKMLGRPHVENLLIYSKMMDHTFDEDSSMKKLVNDLIPLFMGQNAFTHTDIHGNEVMGNWEKLGGDLKDTAQVLRKYLTIADDLSDIQAELISDGKVEDGPAAQPMALLEYLSRLVISQEEYDAKKATTYAGQTYDEIKFQKVDELVDVLYRLMNDFEPIKTFAVDKLANMQVGEMSSYMQTLTTMFDKNINEWRSTLRSVVNMAKLINESPLATLLSNFDDPSSLGDLNAEDFMSVVTSMDASDVTDVLANIMDVPEIGDKVQETLTNVLEQLNDQSTPENAEAAKEAIQQYLTENSDDGVTIDEDDVAAVQTAITELQTVLNQFDETTYNNLSEEEQEALKKTDLPAAVGDLWSMVQGLLHPNND